MRIATLELPHKVEKASQYEILLGLRVHCRPPFECRVGGHGHRVEQRVPARHMPRQRCIPKPRFPRVRFPLRRFPLHLRRRRLSSRLPAAQSARGWLSECVLRQLLLRQPVAPLPRLRAASRPFFFLSLSVNRCIQHSQENKKTEKSSRRDSGENVISLSICGEMVSLCLSPLRMEKRVIENSKTKR